MNVKAVAVTKSLVEGIELSPEELIIYEARVSNPENQGNTQTAVKLLKFLIRNKHWSPFDMVNFTVEVETSRAIAAQILRHWSIKPQEFSQRYAAVKGKIEPIELRFKPEGKSNRQVSEKVLGTINFNDSYVDMTFNLKEPFPHEAKEKLDKGLDLLRQVTEYYEELIAFGIHPECARMFLPLATTTTLYLNGSVRSWIFYLMQRTDAHAQKEHRELAALIEAEFKKYFPNVYEATREESLEVNQSIK